MPAELRPPTLRSDGLQVEDKRAFQRPFWTLQRIAWIGFVVVMAAALLGFTGGGGYFSHHTVEIGGATAVVPSFARWEDSEQMTIELPQSGAVRIVLGSGFTEHFGIDRIQPQPELSESTPSGLRLHFALLGEGSKKVRFNVRAAQPGWPSYELEVDGTVRPTSTLILP